VTGTFAPSEYVTTFIDTEKPVAEADDEISVRVEDADGKLLGQSQAKLTSADINSGVTKIQVNVTSPPPTPQGFTVRGTIYVYDDVTPAGNELKVSVSNVTKNLTETDTTGATAENSQYTVTFVSTDGPVAESGDTIQVEVRNSDRTILLGKATSNLGDAEIAENSAVVHVMLPSFPWDVNKDRVINIFDLVLVAGSFGKPIPDPPPDPNPDVNRDDVINIFDLVIIAGRFDETY
jgi:hypothetical protein